VQYSKVVCIFTSVDATTHGLFFLIGIVGGGVQLGPLGTAAINRPVVPTPGDYDDGEIGITIGKGTQSTRRKPAPVLLCPSQIPHAARMRTLATVMGSQWLTTWAMGRPHITLKYSETEMPLNKILRVDVPVRNVMKGECDVTAWCGYLHLWTPPYDSLITEMKILPDNSLNNA
jgi:hypothetical protein